MTNTDRRTLSEMLIAQARSFDMVGAKAIARDLRRRASEALDGLHCALDISARPALQPIPVRANKRR